MFALWVGLRSGDNSPLQIGTAIPDRDQLLIRAVIRMLLIVQELDGVRNMTTEPKAPSEYSGSSRRDGFSARQAHALDTLVMRRKRRGRRASTCKRFAKPTVRNVATCVGYRRMASTAKAQVRCLFSTGRHEAAGP
jgi:hypothetical protein